MQQISVHTISLHEHPQIWERLHAGSPAATVFSSAEWLTVMADAFQRHATGFVLVVEDQPVAGIPLLVHQRGPLRLASPLPISLYAGLLSKADVFPLDRLLESVEQQFHFISLSAALDEGTQSAFTNRGWRLRQQKTYRISLENMQAVWEGYAQSLRRKLRRAAEAEFQLDASPAVDEIIGMFEQSYLRHGKRPPIPGSAVAIWLRALQQHGVAQCFAARHPDGRCAAVRVVVRSGDVLYDWLAGADVSVAPSASHWLLHSILGRFAEKGCVLFDFMGANTPGITDFKRSFGGFEHEYYEAEWYRPALLRHLNTLRSKQRRILRGFR